jgi:hypothetical protein
MKSFLKWTATIGGFAIGGVIAWTVMQAGRERLRSALSRAEQIADSTRQTLEQTQQVLHDVRTSV